MTKKLTNFLILLILTSCVSRRENSSGSTIKTTLTKSELQDKIKGGWAGQVIGCTFGGSTEFLFKGTMINDYQPIPWDENRCLQYYKNAPGLYDDVYMDLTFVDVFEKEGLDAPAFSFANAFANAGYMLWHANQAARYNVLNGISPPESGNWLNNPHSDDIDFQIEADFAGLMYPGMVNTASEICDKIGHIMNYGDGWYGGVYVAAMYSLAFVSSNPEFVVTEALKTIPAESDFYKCISDVIAWHKQFPDDWKQTWFETERKWSEDVGCPEGVFSAFDIDAKINAAYIVIGLLYGKGDFAKTMEIATRCGQDSDCNPASAGGILGTMLGYSNIPEFWKKSVYPVEDLDFKYTTMSLNTVYKLGFKHALKVLEKKGATIENEKITFPTEKIKPVRLEKGFENHYPKERFGYSAKLNSQTPEIEFTFEGNGFVVSGELVKTNPNSTKDIVLELEMVIDGGNPQKITMPSSFSKRRLEVAWKYPLPDQSHRVKITVLNPVPDYEIKTNSLITYSSKKTEKAWKTILD